MDYNFHLVLLILFTEIISTSANVTSNASLVNLTLDVEYDAQEVWQSRMREASLEILQLSVVVITHVR